MGLPSLYNITTAMLALLEEDATPEQIEAAFGELVEKDNRICHFRADLLGEIKKHKDEEERIATRRKAMENTVARLENYILQSMERLDIPELHAGTFTIKLANNPPSVEVENESAIPAKFYTIIPESKQLDKRRVADALKDGKKVKGCRLVTKKRVKIG